jgi:uncharacterized RDD family membrane protein YckC
MTATELPQDQSRRVVPDFAPNVEQMQGRRAGFVTRAIAYSIDATIVIAGVPTILFGLAVMQGLLRLEPPRYPPDIPTWLTAAISLLWTFWYFVGLWWATGRTIGAVVMGIRVVGRRRENVGVVAATIRWWVMVATLFVVGEVWLIFSRSRLAIHDRAAHTQVVYDRAAKRNEVKVELGAKGSATQPE